MVESIRIALGNMPNREKQPSSSEPEHPGDKSLDNKPVHIKDTDADSKNDTNAEMRRRKMP